MVLQLPNPFLHEKYSFGGKNGFKNVYFSGKPRPNYLVSSSLNQIKLHLLGGMPGRNSSLNSTMNCCFLQAAEWNWHILLSHTQDQLLELTRNFPQDFFPCLVITLCHGRWDQPTSSDWVHPHCCYQSWQLGCSHKHSQRSQHLHFSQIGSLNILTNW